MSGSVKIRDIVPNRAIPSGEIEILVDGLRVVPGETVRCVAGGIECRVAAASSSRVVATMPEIDDSTAIVQVETSEQDSNAYVVATGKLVANEMHIVANPAIDPSDDALILTRSGARGQQLANTLYRLETDGYLDELPVEFLNPTGIAFGPTGAMYVTNRAEGTVSRIDRGEAAVVVASDLGIATGIAFDPGGMMYVGDRSGTIYRVFEDGGKETLALIEPSVAAFHIAFGPDGRLYVSSPGFASHDSIYAVDIDGQVERYVRGLGRPQGLAFDREGNLYAAACYKGRHGVVRIDSETREIEHFIAGGNVVGLCFTRNGEMIVATSDSAYSLNLGIYGTLL
ncbi:MAG TPA: IPT/TIG domain-containing protein [Pyrinomonadaceae bacterium]|nr:IPT/TIG domain-containing protein [Pyrinomonadaceae bacterium]